MEDDDFMRYMWEVMDDDDEILEILRFFRLRKRKPRRIHSVWVKPWILERSSPHPNTMYKLQEELRLHDREEFRCMLRMDTDTFYYLLGKVTPFIQKMNTNARKAIPAAEVLSAVLKFLAFGGVQRDLSRQFRQGRTTVCNKIPLVCEGIYSALKDEYLTTPQEMEKWQEIASGFQARWNFPNCVGALDGKHVRIVTPANSGSTYHNYKRTKSIVLMALVDHNYELIYVDVGTEGKANDGGIWGRCSLKEGIDHDTVDLPRPTCLPGTNVETPFVIVGDDAFSLDEHMMKPFSRRELTDRQTIFNYRLSRARRVSENAFGIIANRFRVFLTDIHLEPDRVESVVLAASCLHNMLRRRCGRNYIPPGMIDYEDLNHDEIPGDWRTSPHQLPDIYPAGARNPTIFAKRIRETLADYFLSIAGRVPWQNKCLQV